MNTLRHEKYKNAAHQLNGRRESVVTLSTRSLDFDLCLRMGRDEEYDDYDFLISHSRLLKYQETAENVQEANIDTEETHSGSKNSEDIRDKVPDTTAAVPSSDMLTRGNETICDDEENMDTEETRSDSGNSEDIRDKVPDTTAAPTSDMLTRGNETTCDDEANMDTEETCSDSENSEDIRDKVPDTTAAVPSSDTLTRGNETTYDDDISEKVPATKAAVPSSDKLTKGNKTTCDDGKEDLTLFI
ncbi:hypothetical protein J6590_065260 [Homalodisca vitripennis]|nr:hypothetical protein J6590_065260 [Homalodisca vitripennis]